MHFLFLIDGLMILSSSLHSTDRDHDGEEDHSPHGYFLLPPSLSTYAITAPIITLHSRSFSRNTNNNNPFSFPRSVDTWLGFLLSDVERLGRARLGCGGTPFATGRSKRDGIA